MKADARMGGHFVTGHVDAVGRVKDIRTLPNYVEYRITLRKGLMRYVVPKGSVAIDGISLTVNDVTAATPDGSTNNRVVLTTSASRTPATSLEL